MEGEKPKNMKETTLRLFSYVGKYKTGFVLAIIFSLISTLASIFSPLVQGMVTSELFRGVQEPGSGINFELIVKILLTLGTLYVLNAAFKYLEQFLMAGVAQRTMYDLRRAVDEKISRLPLRYFDTKTNGEVLSRITNDVDTVQNTLQQGVTQVITSVTTVIGIFIMMLSISPLMTLIAVLTLPLSLFSSMFIVKKSQRWFRAQQKEIGDLNGHVEEMFSGHNVVKAFNRQDKVTEEFEEINTRLYRCGWKAQFLSSIMMPIVGFIGNIGYLLVCVTGGLTVIAGKLLVGEIQSFVQYMRQFTQPISQTANIMNMLQSTLAAAERIFEMLDETEEIPEEKHPVLLQNARGAVSFEHVRFGYSQDKILIHDLNIDIPSGSKIAIVGPTGAGKTTIVNLLLRFYELNGGRITIDGVDITRMTRYGLRELFGMVLQDTWLFGGTIRDNIAYGRLDATEEEIVAAAKSAHAHTFIKQLPGGYGMVLNEDATNISQGQRQLLTIARALLADPEIMILDEATSSVDTRTEVLIQKAMETLMKGRTSFIIAHRLSTIRDADRILVLRDGDIVETGSHQELLDKGGFYAQLYQSQFSAGNIA
ncbi:MAG: ABC transporter ATP-binding protein/permease [Oscillospiraceae bacterium]|nr:ABC transporter ATP-binding protein/permease [Oscillospiraceae bacterium]